MITTLAMTVSLNLRSCLVSLSYFLVAYTSPGRCTTLHVILMPYLTSRLDPLHPSPPSGRYAPCNASCDLSLVAG
jgi:hypothetical protein